MESVKAVVILFQAQCKVALGTFTKLRLWQLGILHLSLRVVPGRTVSKSVFSNIFWRKFRNTWLLIFGNKSCIQLCTRSSSLWGLGMMIGALFLTPDMFSDDTESLPLTLGDNVITQFYKKHVLIQLFLSCSK